MLSARLYLLRGAQYRLMDSTIEGAPRRATIMPKQMAKLGAGMAGARTGRARAGFVGSERQKRRTLGSETRIARSIYTFC